MPVFVSFLALVKSPKAASWVVDQHQHLR
jgi:hypothetical protein